MTLSLPQTDTVLNPDRDGEENDDFGQQYGVKALCRPSLVINRVTRRLVRQENGVKAEQQSWKKHGVFLVTRWRTKTRFNLI